MAQRTPAGAAITDVLVEVVRLAEFFTKTGEALAKRERQTLARWLVLETLEDGPKPVAEIARRLRLARQSVQRVADLLERDGLVAYEANPHHRRAKLARLTPAGPGCSTASSEPSASGRTAAAPRSASATSSGRRSC